MAPLTPTPNTQSSDEPNTLSLSLAGHLEELRRRLGIALAAVVIGMGVSFIKIQFIVERLMEPGRPHITRLAFFNPTEPLIAYFKVAALAGLLLAMPVVLWQAWSFVRSGLKRSERALGLGFIAGGSALFVCGVAFAYTVLIPLSLRFLMGMAAPSLEPVISLEHYLTFVTTIAFWCGVLFEMPAVLTVLARIGIVTPEWLRQQRAYAILAMVTLAAIVTPTTDVASLLLLTLPLIVLYEFSILLAHFVMRRKP